MAKSKSFFGLRTGSTKSLTFQVYRGQQITKDRVTRISNPRSDAQMRQRAIIPIVAASRAALKGLVDHSFEGVAYGDASLKKFSELNLRAGALNVLSYSPNGVSNPGFSYLQVSAGTLSVYGIGYALNDDETGLSVALPTLGKNDLKFKAAQVGTPAIPILKAIADWGATDCEYVAGGNQLTFLTVSNIGNVQVGDNYAPLAAFDVCRLLFPSTETTPSQISDVNGKFRVQSEVKEGASEVHLYNNVVVINIRYSKEDNELVFTIQPTNNPSGSTVAGGTVIRSALVNNVWKRSISKIEFPNDLGGVDRYTYEMWRSYYESTGTSAKYLNRGNEGTGIG